MRASNALAADKPVAAVSPVPAAIPVAEAQTQTSNGSGSNAARKEPAFRLRPEQVRKQQEKKAAMKGVFNALYTAATEEYAEMVRTGKVGKGPLSADGVAASYAAQLPDGCTMKLTGRSLKNAVLQGRVGEAPRAPGRKAAIPALFVKSIAELAQMHQVAGNEQKPRQLAQAAVASAAGTVWEEHLQTGSQRARLLRRVRLEWHLGVTTSTVIDDRRWQWLTSSNLTQWCKAYVQELYNWGFITNIPDDMYETIEIALEIMRRMINADESHQKLSNEGEVSTQPRLCQPCVGTCGQTQV